MRSPLRRHWIWLLPALALSFALCACSAGGSSAGAFSADAAVDVVGDVGAADRATGDLASSDGGDLDDAPEASPDFALPPPAVPLPGGVAPPRLLLDAKATLTGYGTTSCSHQEPASGNGDRWCVFMKPSANAQDAGQTTELWVTDVTRASTGESLPCDGTSPGCLRMTANLWTGIALGGPSHPYSHAFTGDTLIFYANAISPQDQIHRGPVYAWRPGWAQARQISSGTAVMCWGHDLLPLAHCLDDVTGDITRPDMVEVRAGAITDTDGMVLPSLGYIRPTLAGNVPAWQTGFSPAGDLFVISSPDPDPTVETVRVVPTASLGQAMPAEILRDADSWEISKSGHTIYFYRKEGPEQNALYAADFPSGANIAKLGSNVKDFRLLGDATKDAGLVFLTEPNADQEVLHLLRDPHLPASAVTLFTSNGLLEDVEISPDNRYTAWSNEHFDMRIVRHDDLSSCYLNTSTRHDAFAPWFTDSAGLIFWREDAPEDNNRLDGYFADPASCEGRQRFATGVEFTYPIGDRGLIIGDELDERTSTVVLKYAALAAGKRWPTAMAGPVRIADDVGRGSLVMVGSKPLLLLYRTAPGAVVAEGTYLFGPVPF